MKPRVIYMGTPDFAVPALERLAGFDGVDVVLVVTQPDRPAGRGKKLVSPAVKEAADRLDLPVIQTATLRDPDVRRRIVDANPDLVVVAAFGMILGKWILDLPRLGCVNLHASLLPAYRGANPIAAAIAAGELETGVTLMRMDRGLDTGPIYGAMSIPIEHDDTTESLTPKLADLAGDVLQRYLPELLDGTLAPSAQPEGATLTRLMTKDDGWLDFGRSSVELERHVRAMWPWPRAWTATQDGMRLQVHRAAAVTEAGMPGVVVHVDRRVLVGCGDGSLELQRVQLPGGKPQQGHVVVQIPALAAGTTLGTPDAPESFAPLVAAVEEGS